MITKNEKLTEEKDKVKIKRNKMFTYQKEWKPFLFADGMIVYIENPKESTRKLLG